MRAEWQLERLWKQNRSWEAEEILTTYLHINKKKQ